MSSKFANRITDRSQIGSAFRACGQKRDTFAFGSQRAAGLEIAEVKALPARPSTTRLTNDAGQFIFLADYSAADGGDVAG